MACEFGGGFYTKNDTERAKLRNFRKFVAKQNEADHAKKRNQFINEFKDRNGYAPFRD